MTATTMNLPNRRRTGAMLAFAAFGLLWSLFGVYQFMISSLSTAERLVARGLTAAQADLYASAPVWMDAAFAIGAFGGVVGSALLLMGRRASVPVLGASLAGYVVLFVGDVVTGVFAAFGPSQIVVLTFVVAVAAGLLLTARRAIVSRP